MRTCRALLALALVLLVGASYAGEITTLKGGSIACDIVSVGDKEVVYKVDGKEVKVDITGVLKVEYGGAVKAPTAKTYAQVELTDGSIVMATSWSIKRKEFEMKLAAGPAVKVPVETIANVLNSGELETHRREWKTRVFNTRGKDAIVVNREGVIVNLLATFGPGDEKGEKIKFVAKDDDEEKERTYAFAKMHGMIFRHLLDSKAPPILCRLQSTTSDLVMVSSVAAGDKGAVIVTTPSGAKIEYAADQLAWLDYQKGKLDYLSQLIPKVTTKATFDDGSDKWFVYKDSNLHNKPISLGGVPYRFGLTLLPEVELEYDLKGNYTQFSAVIGIDDETKAEGELVVEIKADRKVVATIPIEYKTTKGKGGEVIKPVRPSKQINLGVKNVQKLEIIVKAKDELSGLSISVSLGDAKVNK